MALTFTHATQQAAEAALTAEGFALRIGDEGTRYFAKASKVDDFYGAHATTALVSVQHRRVDPAYGPDYHEIVFW